MPHLIIEATPALAQSVDLAGFMRTVHERLSENGDAALDDFKSRVHVPTRHLAGLDPAAEFIVVRLVTTHPRPAEQRRTMAAVVLEVLQTTIATTRPAYWWQCCVLLEAFEADDYFKFDSNAAHPR